MHRRTYLQRKALVACRSSYALSKSRRCIVSNVDAVSVATQFETLPLFEISVAAVRLAKSSSRPSPQEWDAIFEVILKRLPSLANTDVVSLCGAVTSVYSPGKRAFLHNLANRIVNEVTLLAPADLARAATSLSSPKGLPSSHPAFMALMESANMHCAEFPANDAVTLLHGLSKAKLGGGPGGVFNTFVPQLVGWIDEFYPNELSLIADAYMRVAVKSPQLFSALAPRVQDSIADFDDLNIATLVRAYAAVKIPEASAILSVLANQIVATIDSIELRYLAAIGWAFAHARHEKSSTLLESIAQHVHKRNSYGHFNAQEMVNLLSAYAKLRVRSPDMLGGMTKYLETNPEYIRKMTSLDLLYISSSLYRLGVNNKSIFIQIAESVIHLGAKPSAKQAIYLLHAFSQTQCTHEELFESQVDCLHAALRVEERLGAPSKSDWVVAFGAFANSGLATLSVRTTSLCRDMILRCCDISDGRSQAIGLSSMDISLLLRALANVWIDGLGPAVELLTTSFLAKHVDFSPPEFLTTVNAVIQLKTSEHEASQASVPSHLYESILSLLSEEIVSGRLKLIEPPAIAGAATALGVAGYADAASWNSLITQLRMRIINVTKQGNAAFDLQHGEIEELTYALVVILNNCARLRLREEMMISLCYKWVAWSSQQGGRSLSTDRAAVIVGSLAKLAASSAVELSKHDITSKEYMSAWRWFQMAPDGLSSSCDLTYLPVFLHGLAHALAGNPSRSSRDEFGAVLCQTMRRMAPRSTHEKSLKLESNDFLMSYSQIMTAMQCLFTWAYCIAFKTLQQVVDLRDILDIVEPALLQRRIEGRVRFQEEVMDALESICVQKSPDNPLDISIFGVPNITLEAAVLPYFIDIAITP